MRPKPTWHPYINRDDPLAQGLVGAWFALEGAGPLAHDLSRNGNHGSLQGDVSWVAGRDGPVLDFPGNSGDFIIVPDRPELRVGHITIFAMVYIRDVANFVPTILSKYYDGSSISYELRIDDTSTPEKLDFVINLGGIDFQVSSPSPAGEWFAAAATYDGETMRLFLDGQEENTNTSPSGNIATNTADVYIGEINHTSASDRNWDGFIGTALLYNRALPAASIRRLHADPYALLRPVRRWWPAVEVTAAGITHPVIGSDVVGSPIIRSLS